MTQANSTSKSNAGTRKRPRKNSSNSIISFLLNDLIPFKNFLLFADLLSATGQLERSVKRQRKIHEKINLLFEQNFNGCTPEQQAQNTAKIAELNKELRRLIGI